MDLNSPLSGSNRSNAIVLMGYGQLGLNRRMNELRISMERTTKGSWAHVYPREKVSVVESPLVTNVKASDWLKAELLRVPGLAPKNMFFGNMQSAQPAPPLRHELILLGEPIRFVNHFGFESQEWALQKPREAVNEVKSGSGNEVFEKYDGRIHSYRHKKNGPYTCPKCMGVYATSQRFAAHVSSLHYKFESRSERTKRLMARFRKRNKLIEWVNGKPGFVPGVPLGNIAPNVAFGNSAPKVGLGHNNNNVVAPLPPLPPALKVNVVVKAECDDELSPPPGFEKISAAKPGFPLPF
ncbi:unnamed protein product [Sphenostylis stenocarpa]|uniref:C2H2-type domain-containing protein n=1 Tax=Sphenostylis stenocarpa TaxID=92480 RepID=A0AA86W3M2_9FABA|nr:unnamed protein product [Sphenostylis stenocarpa]